MIVFWIIFIPIWLLLAEIAPGLATILALIVFCFACCWNNVSDRSGS